MTLVSAKSNGFLWPGVVEQIGGAPSVSNDVTVDAAGEYQCFVGIAEQDMSITHIHGRFGSTGSGTAVFSIESIGTDGIPSGAGFGSSASAATLLTNNAWASVALGATATVPRGSIYGIKVLYSSGTTVVCQRISNLNNQLWQLPYEVSNISGSATLARSTGTKILCPGPSSTTIYPATLTYGAIAITGGTFNNTTTDRKRGASVTLPFKARIVGMQWYNGNNTGDYNVLVEDSSGNELSSSSTAMEGTIASAAGSYVRVYFDNPVTLSAGTQYRVMVFPSSATNVNMQALQASDATYISSGFPGLGAYLYSTATVTPTYTDNTDQVPLMDLLLDQVDDGTGTGARGSVYGNQPIGTGV